MVEEKRGPTISITSNDSYVRQFKNNIPAAHILKSMQSFGVLCEKERPVLCVVTLLINTYIAFVLLLALSIGHGNFLILKGVTQAQ